MIRPTLQISRDQFRTNIAAVERRIAPSALMLVMKDDAYGHGLGWAVEEAADAGVTWFGGYDIRTALRIRRLLVGSQRVLAWATSTDEEIAEALLHDIDLGIGTSEYLRRVIAQAQSLGRRAHVHLKIDTGLRRNGVLPTEWDGFVAEARAAEGAGTLEVVGVWSHLAEASDPEDDEAQQVFLTAVDAVRRAGSSPELLHLTASAASWWRPELRGSLSRVGAFCYGIRSADGPELDGIRPIATLSVPVVHVDDGDAVIAIGSFDGLPSTLAGIEVGTPAGLRLLREVDATTSIVAGWPGMQSGDQVRVFGPGDQGEQSATTLAERIGTVGEEILTRLTPRVRRTIV
ncbi:alanine racemase [Microbacterium sp. LWH12-1.2]|uniref:alanine racemase n=1 Tax=Microbacterium sp. LWH12-1.2 TaxID=3135259 RepID=UPI00342125E6